MRLCFRSMAVRISGPFVSISTAQWLPLSLSTFRRHPRTCSLSLWEPIAMLITAASMPASSSLWMLTGSQQRGPMVHTIFVFRAKADGRVTVSMPSFVELYEMTSLPSYAEGFPTSAASSPTTSVSNWTVSWLSWMKVCPRPFTITSWSPVSSPSTRSARPAARANTTMRSKTAAADAASGLVSKRGNTPCSRLACCATAVFVVARTMGTPGWYLARSLAGTSQSALTAIKQAPMLIAASAAEEIIPSSESMGLGVRFLMPARVRWESTPISTFLAIAASVEIVSAANDPTAVSRVSINPSAPSNTAFAASVISALVGLGLPIMLSIISSLTRTVLPASRAVVTHHFWASATFSDRISLARRPLPRITPSASFRIAWKCRKASAFSIRASTPTEEPARQLRTCLMSSASWAKADT
mmetsp:Transcript_24190/g.67265  ORF Transcript_24190/g.67265 Transcript_24190/m.67265 type:complete len:415 (-) Transcript_24190:1293-2537(-)